MRLQMVLRPISHISVLFLLLLLAACASTAEKRAVDIQPSEPVAKAESSIPANPYQLKINPLQFSPPAPDISTLPNGIKVYIYENHELPLVTVQAKTRVGSIYEPAEKIGLAGLVGEVMRTGGTKTWSGSELDAKLEFIAADLSNGIGQESGEAALDVRKQDLETGLQMMAEMLRAPRFEQDKIELGKLARLEAIRRRNDNPSGIAQREFTRLLYGKDSPWARIAQPGTIKAIARKDIIDFYKKYYHPNNMMIGISGDITKEEALSLITKHFGDWAQHPVEFPSVRPVDPNLKPGIYYVQREIPQSIILLGHFGYRRLDPAQLSLTLLNEVFGAGGFSSRLMREVRSNRGLAYSTYGYISKGTDLGMFVMNAETQVASTLESAKVMQSEMQKITVGPVSEQELNLAREAEVNRFVFPFDSPSQIVSLKMDLDFYNYPPDWLSTYVDRLNKVSVEDVQTAARKFLHPDQMIILIVGDITKFMDSLNELGFGQPQELKLDPVE